MIRELTTKKMSRKEREKRIKQQKAKEQQKAKRKELIYQLKPLMFTFVVWFALKALFPIPAIGNVVAPNVVNFTTHAAYWFGKVLFIPVEMSGAPFLAVNGFTMKVIWECTAYNFYLFVIVLTIFARWPLKFKFISLAIFLGTIFVMNNMRFITMGYVGSYWPNMFDVVHDYLWSILFGFLVFFIWAWRETKAQRLAKPKTADG